VIYLLPVNLYGPRDHFFEPEKSHVIPALIRSSSTPCDAGAPEVIVWGSGYFKGTPVSREFLYVEDAAEAIAFGGRPYDGAEPVNVGAGREWPINDLIAMVCQMTNYRGKVVAISRSPTASPPVAWTSPARRRSSASSPARRRGRPAQERSRGTSRRGRERS